MRSVFLKYTGLVTILASFFLQGLASGYSFERLSLPLTHSNVITVTQDEQGFMWFGTRDGLNRYDGVNMVTFHHNSFDSTSLINNLVNTIKVCNDSLLWIGTYEGLSLFDPNLFTFSPVKKQINLNFNPDFGNVLSIDTGKNGQVWMGTIANGVYFFDKENDQWGQFRSDRKSGGICNDWVNAVKCDSKGRVWAGTRDGLSLIENQGERITNYRHNPNNDHTLSDNYVTAIAEDSCGTIWIATNNMGLQKIIEKNGKISFERINFYKGHYTENPGFSILSLLFDKWGNLWIGTENGGLFVIETETGKITRYMNDPFDNKSLAGNSIYTLFQSEDGIVWIGTYNQGVCFYDPNKLKFEHFFLNPTESNFLNCNIIKCMWMEEDELIIGTDGGGMTMVDWENKKPVHFTKDSKNNNISSNTIMALCPDYPRGIWLGTWDAGMNYYDKRTGRFKHYNTIHNQHETYNVEHITAFLKDSRGNLWIGTFGFGLNYYYPEDDKIVHFSGRDAGNSVFDSENIYCIYETSQGELLCGTMDGLYRIQNLEKNPLITRYQYDSNDSLSISNNLVVSVFEDVKNQIWIGTIGGGLNLFDPETETFHRFSEKDGLPENTIRSIYSDQDDKVWISTNLGIACLNPENNTIKAYRSNILHDVGEFLPSSATIDTDGFLYFGGSNGFIRFHPRQIVENPNIPPVYFSDFRLFNQSVQINEKKSPLSKHISSTTSIELSHKQSVISIDFVALNYTEPNHNRYAYYLEGFEPYWNYSGHNNTATYTNLNPGRYTFKVKASNNDGIWNPQPKTLKIRVKAPGWATWWAFSGYIFILSALFYIILKIYKDRAVEKEQIKAERLQNHNMQELKDRKLAFFTNLSHEIRTPLSLIITPLEELLDYPTLKDEVRKKIKYAAENSKFLLKLVNQLLDIRKLDNQKMELRLTKTNIDQLLLQVLEMHKLRAREKQVELIYEPLGADTEFYFDTDKIEKIANNLLSNAVKFSHNEDLIIVRVSNKKDEGKLTIEVIDHGIGMEPDQIPRIFERFYQGNSALNKGGTGIGLALCKELAEIHQGCLEVESTPGEGSCFRVNLPVSLETYDGLTNVVIEKDILPEKNSLDTSDKLTAEQDEKKTEKMKYSLAIIEDDQQIRSYLADEFSKIYKTYWAGNGEDGMKLIDKYMPDIVICDILMPGMNGLELCKKVKGNIETSHIPVILLTAKVEIEDQIGGLELGADAYVPKPFNMRYLKVLVKNTLDKRSSMYKAFSQKPTIIPSEFSTNKMDEDFLNKVINYIEKNIENTELSVDLLARNMNLSRSQVYRKIKALTNLTANEFIRQLRLKKALKLLSEGGLTISEIAYSVGFSSQSYFTRSFKEYYGKSPSEIRG
ncbi:MAG: helix-turn-helix domain-containing protein [Prolixibacteraceae bacterium]|nr:helix-turn-helix domain-containing protein [Prolixibacteraceae bacterium]